MSSKILCSDSDYDNECEVVAHYRRDNLYQKLDDPIILRDAVATRRYVSENLLDVNMSFFSASGHGNEEEMIGQDYSPILEIGQYQAHEVSGKIIHFLACSTAFTLGRDLVNKGCKAFFGYDAKFLYVNKYLREFMAPDMAIDLAIAQGKTAADVHEIATKIYKELINDPTINPTIAGYLQTNLTHLCTPVTSNQWGDVAASI